MSKLLTICFCVAVVSLSSTITHAQCKGLLKMHKENSKDLTLYANKPDTIIFSLACIEGCQISVEPKGDTGIELAKLRVEKTDNQLVSASYLITAQKPGTFKIDVYFICPNGTKLPTADGKLREVSGKNLYVESILEIK